MALEMAGMLQTIEPMIQYMQIIVYAGLVLFFGGSAVKGWKGFLPFYFAWPFRIVAGFVCLVFGVAMADYVPILSTGILRLFQSHILAAGLVAAILMSIAFYFISIRLPSTVESYRREIERLHRKVQNLRKVKPNKVMSIVGVVIILAIVVLAAVNWRGFPANMAEDLLSSVIPEGELPGGMILGPGALHSECISIMTTIQTLQQEHPELFQDMQTYQNSALKSSIEEHVNASVVEMYLIEYEGKRIVLSITDDMKSCISSDTELCGCSEMQQ